MGTTKEAQRQAVRTITVSYETKEETRALEVCRALTDMGIMALDNTWEYQEFNRDAFADKEQEDTKYTLTLKTNPELVWVSDYRSDCESIMEAMPDIFDFDQITTKTLSPPRWIGGSRQSLLVKWSDMAGDNDDGYSIVDLDTNTVISAKGSTIDGSLTITIVGPSDSLEGEFVEESVGFLTHRWDSVFRSFGFADPLFNCEVNLSYHKVVGCDVSWLAKQMPRDAKQEEE